MATRELSLPPTDLPPTKVLYVMGVGASGTTVFGNVLGEVDGFVHAGELRALWRPGLQGQERCGCGRLVRDCPTWASIVRAAFGDALDDPAALAFVSRAHLESCRIRSTRRILRFQPGVRSGWPPLDAYLPVIDRFVTSERSGSALLITLVVLIEELNVWGIAAGPAVVLLFVLYGASRGTGPPRRPMGGRCPVTRRKAPPERHAKPRVWAARIA